MEGRTIARPDAGPARMVTSRNSLQWRAGQLPGQTWCPRAARPSSRSFNGGPDNCPARPRWVRSPAPPPTTFNGGPDNCPARPLTAYKSPSSTLDLQWRAGQLPGQTGFEGDCDCDDSPPSMEGRTIARPDAVRQGHRRLAPQPSMEGRTIARPDLRPRLYIAPGTCPSMEGRTIARPDSSMYESESSSWLAFNGGPDNCPARPPNPGTFTGLADHPSMEGRTIARPDTLTYVTDRFDQIALQWRAGQLPGQTSTPIPRAASTKSPSMEGRTIARPDQSTCTRSAAPAPPFNGGPDNCPARLDQPVAIWPRTTSLQWRAGQLPGQTRRRGHHRQVAASPSMEGRTIARPDQTLSHADRGEMWRLQWRAGQLPGQTQPWWQTVGVIIAFNGGPDNCPARHHRVPADAQHRHIPFNGGPDNCPARLLRGSFYRVPQRTFNGGPDNCPARRHGPGGPHHRRGAPSMEGRTIARPDSGQRNGLIRRW